MNYRNAKYINNNGWIDCEIEHPVHGWGPYTLSPVESDVTARKNNNDLLELMAVNGDVAAYIPPTQARLDEALSAQIRDQRDALLYSEVDVIAGNALRWAALDAATQSAWSAYRQALLEVPQQSGFPNDVVWPVSPS